MSHEETLHREDFPYLIELQTRWSDFDMLRHMNNVAYYRCFETVICDYLAEAGLDWFEDPVIPFAAESLCRFRRALDYCRRIEAGLRVTHLGRSSVRYQIGLFALDEATPFGCGHFVHVYVERASERPAPIPERLRAAYQRLLVSRD